MVCYVEFEDVKNIIEQLPNLRRLGWKAMHGWPDYNGAISMDLDPVAEQSNLEALYLTLTNATGLPQWAFDTFGRGSKLKELVVFCSSSGGIGIVGGSPFYFNYPGADNGGPATSDDVMYFVKRSLPHATTIVIDKNAGGHAYPDWDGPDALHRVLLPATLELWHLAGGTHGLEHLRL